MSSYSHARATGRPIAAPGEQTTATEKAVMSDTELIEVTTSADTALGDVDFEAAGGKNSVRIYLLGFG